MRHPAAGCLACMGDFLMLGAVVDIIGGWRAAAFAALAVCAGSYASIQTVRLHHAQLVIAETAKLSAQAQADAQAKARAIAQAKAKAVADIAESYERGKQDAQSDHDRMLADLRSDNRKLRAHWQASIATGDLSRAAAAAAFGDGGAELRQRDVAALRGIIGRCEAQVRSCQSVVRQYNQ